MRKEIACVAFLILSFCCSVTTPAITQEKSPLWIAFAVTIYDGHLRTGMGFRGTVEQANARAMQVCQESGYPGCKLVGTFKECGFMATYTNQARRDQGWAVASTRNEAIGNCTARSHGVACAAAGVCDGKGWWPDGRSEPLPRD
jgi:hypothetical protein